jgi:hypothetical protein
MINSWIQDHNAERYYFFECFGLTFRSSIDLPELNITEPGFCDVEIRITPTPRYFAAAPSDGLRFQASRGVLVFTVDRIAKFIVSDGNLIEINACNSARGADVRLFLLESALQALLLQREELVLRGCAVQRDGLAYLFLGPSGIGKSTLAVALAQRGFKLLTDDFCVIRRNGDGKYTVASGPAHSKLWRDSLKKLGIPYSNLSRVRQDTDRFIVPNESPYMTKQTEVAKTYFLRSAPRNDVQLTPADSALAYSLITQRPHLPLFYNGLKLEGIYRQLALTFVTSLPFSILERPKRGFLVNQLVKTIESDLYNETHRLVGILP